ncbi:MAG: phosphoribosyltransferase family protein [Bacteroidota bacterium]
MSQLSTLILSHEQIANKIKRLAWQIYENNMDEGALWIAGIDERGQFIAGKIAEELRQISGQPIKTFAIQINRENFEPRFISEDNFDDLQDASVIIVDDVLNSGKTIVSSFLPLLNRQVRKIEVAVLASRSHRLYPIKADYVGISMATTIQEHLLFDNADVSDLKLLLQ